MRTVVPKTVIRRIARAMQARNDFREFFRQAWAELYPAVALVWGRHIEAVCLHVAEQLRDRWRALGDPGFAMRAQNILINVPPRSLKSTILAIACAWAWLHEPTMKIAAYTANPEVSLTNARIVHTLIQSEWYASIPVSLTPDAVPRPGGALRMDPERSALTSFGLLYHDPARGGRDVKDAWRVGGSRIAKGLDSNITGIGADWSQIDDPHDVRDSEAQIKTTVDGYDAAVHNRINDPRTSIRTAIMQRFRVDDFSGHVLAKHGADPGRGGWLHVRMPTEFETRPQCPCGTCVAANVYGWRDWRSVEGEPIHPRFTADYIAEEKRTKGPYGYAGQHQQTPSPPSGGMWKTRWFGWFRLPEDGDPGAWQRPAGANADPPLILSRNKRGRIDGLEMICISIDGTFGNLKEHDGSAVGFGVWGFHGNRRLLLDEKTEPISYIDTLDRIRETASVWATESALHVLVEPKAFGPMAVEQLRRDVANGWYVDADGSRRDFVDRNGRKVVMVVEVVRGADIDGEGRKGVAGDKVTRFYAASSSLAAGLVMLREGRPYVAPYVGETAMFPKASRDDRVDQTTQMINHYGETSDVAHARAMLLG